MDRVCGISLGSHAKKCILYDTWNCVVEFSNLLRLSRMKRNAYLRQAKFHTISRQSKRFAHHSHLTIRNQRTGLGKGHWKNNCTLLAGSHNISIRPLDSSTEIYHLPNANKEKVSAFFNGEAPFLALPPFASDAIFWAPSNPYPYGGP